MTETPTIYYSRPFTGLKIRDIFTYDKQVLDLLSQYFEVQDPLRGKVHLLSTKLLINPRNKILDDFFDGLVPENHPSLQSTYMMSRDHSDVVKSDAVFVDFTNAKQVSIGCVAEISWAYHEGIPVFINNLGKHHDHFFIKEMATYIGEDLFQTVSDLAAYFGSNVSEEYTQLNSIIDGTYFNDPEHTLTREL